MRKKTTKTILLFLILLAVLLAVFLFYLFSQEKFKKLYRIAKTYQNGTHLVLFQNNAEIRPTGGFIGSFALVKTKNFFIKDVYFETNIYKRDNEFIYQHTLLPKDEVLRDFVPEQKLQLRDSNWSIDFEDAATEIAYIYGYYDTKNQLDTITAINSNFFVDILSVIGPIKMPKYAIEINSDNFNEIIQEEIENKYNADKDNFAISEPKSILTELMPIATNRMKKPKHFNDLLNTFLKNLEQKHIQIFSFHAEHQKNMIDYNYAGKIVQTDANYLHINHANLIGGKSSLYIEENIVLEIVDEQEGDFVKNKLSINRFNHQSNYIYDNNNFTRILIPYNSQLLSSEKKHEDEIDFDVEQQDQYGYMVLRFFSTVFQGKGNEFSFVYQIPKDDVFSRNKLLIQKQSGAIKQHITIIYNNKTIYSDNFERDLYLDLPTDT